MEFLLHCLASMTRSQLFKIHPKEVRDTVDLAVEMSDQLLENERKLILQLTHIDSDRLYLRYGFRSLRPFCEKTLRFTRTQAQRIVTEVRRSQFIIKVKSGAEKN